MGVLACDRLGCENIMCDRYSARYGYICDECFEELIYEGPETHIEVFMQTEKKDYDRYTEAKTRFDHVFSKE